MILFINTVYTSRVAGFIENKVGGWLPGPGGGGTANCLVETEFQFCKMKKF